MYFPDRVFYGNTLQVWSITIIYAFVAYVILVAAKKVILNQLVFLGKRIHKESYDLTIYLFRNTKQFFLILLSLYIASHNLTLNSGVISFIDKTIMFFFFVQIAIWGNLGISYWLESYTQRNLTKDAATVTTVTAMTYVVRIFFFVLIILLIMDNMGFNVKTFIAGLGIGGVAVALAVQNILKDLLASLSIALDKPFVYGDAIDIGSGISGTVEHIGLKTTKIRSATGEQIILSNSDLLQSRIRNHQRIQKRRIVFTIGVTYQTPVEKLQKIPEMIRKIIERDKVRFERIHFTKLGDFSLNFEISYCLTDPDYNFYMDTQHDINLKIYESFEREGIAFAYPTQTLLLEKTRQGEGL